MNETRIAELRKARGWTQERLGQESGVAVRTIQRLEAGKDASLETIKLLADALDVPVRDLFANVEKVEFEAAVGGLDERRSAQQERRDAMTRAFEQMFRGVGILVVFATVVFWMTGHFWPYIWLIVPAYWVGGRYVLRSVFRLLADPWLDRRYPLSRPSRPRARPRESEVI